MRGVRKRGEGGMLIGMRVYICVYIVEGMDTLIYSDDRDGEVCLDIMRVRDGGGGAVD